MDHFWHEISICYINLPTKWKGKGASFKNNFIHETSSVYAWNIFVLDWSEFAILQEFLLSGCLSSIESLRTLQDMIN